MLEELGMCAVNTFYNSGPTFWSHQFATTSRIDFICVPKAFLNSGRVLAVWVDIDKGDRSQLIRSSLRADHRPLGIRLDAVLGFTGKTDRSSWNFDSIMASRLKGGKLKKDFIAKVEAKLDTACAGNFDDKWIVIRDAVRDAGQEVFADSTGTGTLASKERLAALKAR
eukprot:9915122-Heterocapsa_arctica.AAC.1